MLWFDGGTSGNYAKKKNFYSGRLQRFHGYGGVHVMSCQFLVKG